MDKSENLFKKLLYPSSRFQEASISSQLLSYNFCFKNPIDFVSNTTINMTVFLVLFVCFIEDGIMKQIGKWSDMSLIKMTNLKTVSVKEFVRIWFIAVVIFCATLIGLLLESYHLYRLCWEISALSYLHHGQVDSD